MNMKKCLIVAAHPDDEVLGCGGVISKFSKSVEFSVLFIAEGTSCRYDFMSEESRKEMEIRKQCSLRALDRLGVYRVFFKDLPCGRLDTQPLLDINKCIEKEISSFRPDTVFTHWSQDSNIDHRKVYDATVIATRPYSSVVKNVFCYEVLTSTEWNFKESFKANLFYSLSEKNIKDKCLAMEDYYTECKPWPYPRSSTGIETLAKYRGMQSGNQYAEAFQVLRINR